LLHDWLATNNIDVAITSADQVDEYTWTLSHELAERISTGTGSLTGVGPSAGNQICDGEPEGNNFYAARLPGTNGPLVTSYWSFIDQAYIIPDGKLDRTLLVPVWNKNSWTGTTPCAVFSVIYNGQLLADHQISRTRFRNIMKKLGM